MRARIAVAAGVALALAASAWLTSGPPEPKATPAGTFAFAALGDAPYYPWEEVQYRLVVREIDATDLAFVLHIGDIFWRPCSNARYREVRARFDRSRHPLFYTPGDNEWTDCWEAGSGDFRPLERLARLRAIFFDDPGRSFGRSVLEAESQGGEHPENVRWTHGGVVFATVHLVGSHNARERFPGRLDADDEAATRRTEAAAEWTRASFGAARAAGARAVVVGFHANPGLEEGGNEEFRKNYEPFLGALHDEAARFGGPVLIVQGDDHDYVVDRPLRARNVTRLQVPGSPRVGWVRVVVDPAARDPFSFEEHVVPRWKYW